MSNKTQKSNRETKKPALLSLKEKRAAKHHKREEQNSPHGPIIIPHQ